MTTQKEQKPRETTREAETERKPTNPKEAHEGAPGYGQPPEEVRKDKLPDQKW